MHVNMKEKDANENESVYLAIDVGLHGVDIGGRGDRVGAGLGANFFCC